MNKHANKEEYQIKILRNSKYKRLNTWIEGSGELSDQEIAAIIYFDEIDSLLETPKTNLPEHPLTNEGLKIAYNNLKDIEVNPEDLKSIT